MTWEQFAAGQALFNLAFIVYVLAPLFHPAPKLWQGVDPSELPGFLNRRTRWERVKSWAARWRMKLAAMVEIFAMKEIEYREVVRHAD